MPTRILQAAFCVAMLAAQGKTETQSAVPDSVLHITKIEAGRVTFTVGADPIVAMAVSDTQGKPLWFDTCTRPFQPGTEHWTVDRGGSIDVVVTARGSYGDKDAARRFSRGYDESADFWHQWLATASSYSGDSKAFVEQLEAALANTPRPGAGLSIDWKDTTMGHAFFLLQNNVHDLGRQTVQDPREAILLYLNHEATMFDACGTAARREP
jgi:hypothetical protein